MLEKWSLRGVLENLNQYVVNMGLVYMYADEGGGFYNPESDLISGHATFQ